MSMFDDYDAQSFKKAKHAATAAGNGQPTESPSSSQQQGSSDSSGGSESGEQGLRASDGRRGSSWWFGLCCQAHAVSSHQPVTSQAKCRQ